MRKIDFILNRIEDERKNLTKLKGARRDDLGKVGEFVRSSIEGERSLVEIERKLSDDQKLLDMVFDYLQK